MRRIWSDYIFPWLAMLGFLLLMMFVSAWEAEAQPYMVTLPTTCTKTVTDTPGLNAEINSAQPGAVICLGAGTYAGLFTLSRAGTAADPIVVKADGHAIVTGSFRITGAHNYIRDIEITGGTANLTEGIALSCSNCGAINNVIHGINGAVGIGAWNNGPQIIYGNIVYSQTPNNNNPHNIYTQNDYNTHGYKYFIANVSIDTPLTGNTQVFHAYTEGNLISGMWVERNIFANERFILGGFNEPHHHEVIKQNYFYRSNVVFGYRRPLQSQVEDNYIARSSVGISYLWGDGEVQYRHLQTEPSIFRRNKILFPLGKHIDIRTSAYTAPNVRQECDPKFRAGDIFNDNEYGGDFSAALCVGGINAVNVGTLAEWRTWTLQRGGIQFDANSTESAIPPPTQQFFIPNEYDPTRGWIVVYNWQGLQSIPFARSGSFSVYDPKDSSGSPIVTGTNSVDIPLTREFQVFLFRGSTTDPEPEPECDLATAYKLAVELMAIRLNADIPSQKKVRQMGKKGFELTECLELLQVP